MHFYYTKKVVKNFVILYLIIFFFLTSCSKKDNDFYRVVNIHDGDTVSITIKSLWGISLKTEKVRLIGIDAPEIDQKPWGIKARNHLKKLIKESDWFVRLEFDIQHRDRYGRLLAYLWDRNGRMLNYLMLRDGYAVIYTMPPNVKHVSLFIHAQQLARQEKKGIWGTDGLKELPSKWREKNRG